MRHQLEIYTSLFFGHPIQWRTTGKAKNFQSPLYFLLPRFIFPKGLFTPKSEIDTKLPKNIFINSKNVFLFYDTNVKQINSNCKCFFKKNEKKLNSFPRSLIFAIKLKLIQFNIKEVFAICIYCLLC